MQQSTASWTTNFAALQRFVETHGRVPSCRGLPGRNRGEKRLREWMHLQRRNFATQRGAFLADCADPSARDNRIAMWSAAAKVLAKTPDAGTWSARFAELQDFVAENERLPRRRTEKELAHWMHTQRIHHAKCLGELRRDCRVSWHTPNFKDGAQLYGAARVARMQKELRVHDGDSNANDDRRDQWSDWNDAVVAEFERLAADKAETM